MSEFKALKELVATLEKIRVQKLQEAPVNANNKIFVHTIISTMAK